jgi:hypothetical protein
MLLCGAGHRFFVACRLIQWGGPPGLPIRRKHAPAHNNARRVDKLKAES